MAGDIFGRRSQLEVEERKAGWGADEGGRLVRGAALTWAMGERGDAGACAGRAGWAAARSWRVSGSRPARAGLSGREQADRTCWGEDWAAVWAAREGKAGRLGKRGPVRFSSLGWEGGFSCVGFGLGSLLILLLFISIFLFLIQTNPN